MDHEPCDKASVWYLAPIMGVIIVAYVVVVFGLLALEQVLGW